MRAGLAESHVGKFERGDCRPRWKTAQALMKALQLTLGEREEFIRLWSAAGTPAAAQPATRALDRPEIVRWRHLPAQLFDLPHKTTPAPYCDPDRVLEEVVLALDPLLCWVAVATGGGPPLDVVQAAVTAARADAHGATPSVVRRAMDPADREAAAVQAALPQCVRGHLFATAAATSATLSLLAGWAYVLRPGAYPADALFVRFSRPNLHARYGVAGIAAAEVAGVSRTLLVAHYWDALGLAGELGEPSTDRDLIADVAEYSTHARELLKLSADEAAQRLYPNGADQPADGAAFDELAYRVRHARFRARLFDLPALALDLLGLPSPDSRAALLAKCDELAEPLARAAAEFDVDQVDPLAGLPRPRRKRSPARS